MYILLYLYILNGEILMNDWLQSIANQSSFLDIRSSGCHLNENKT